MSGNDTLVALAMTCASAWMEAALADPDGGQRLVVYDEAWRLMRLPTLLARMQSQWKLSRHWGIANLMVIHRLSDLDAVGESDSSARNLALGLLADTSTRIVYAQESGRGGEDWRSDRPEPRPRSLSCRTSSAGRGPVAHRRPRVRRLARPDPRGARGLRHKRADARTGRMTEQQRWQWTRRPGTVKTARETSR